jgi:hypothetical protein
MEQDWMANEQTIRANRQAVRLGIRCIRKTSFAACFPIIRRIKKQNVRVLNSSTPDLRWVIGLRVGLDAQARGSDFVFRRTLTLRAIFATIVV